MGQVIGKDGTGFVFSNEMGEMFLYKQSLSGEEFIYTWNDMVGWFFHKKLLGANSGDIINKYRMKKVPQHPDSEYHKHVGILEPEEKFDDVKEYEHLMIPRIKIIAPIPTFIHKAGDIIIFDQGFDLDRDGEVGINITLAQIDEYKHLFRLLHWYENREINQLPPYISIHGPHDISTAVFKVDRWSNDISTTPINSDHDNERMMNRVLSIDWHYYRAYSKPSNVYQYNSYLCTGLQARAAELGRPVITGKQT